jgi:hypothetical protein
MGAGVSRSSQTEAGASLPDWVTLLQEFRPKVSSSVRSVFDRKLDQQRLLDAAQLIVDDITPADFDAELRKILQIPGLHQSAMHEALVEIDQPVVITTNYDKIYESYWNSLHASASPPAAYAVCRYYEDDAVNHLRSDRRLIMKIHGCVDHPDKIVMSRSQYFSAKRDYSNYYQVVNALLLTHSVLFLGYGFNGDPDIELVLENAAIVAPRAYPHFALVPSGRHDSEIRAVRKTFNIEMLEYSAADHSSATRMVCELRDAVLAERNALGIA